MINRTVLERIVDAALNEDIGSGDVTSEAVTPAGAWAAAVIVAKQQGVLAGIPVAAAVFARVDSDLRIESLAPEGERVQVGQTVARLEGSARAILTGERTALNFLQRLSGVATAAAAFTAACAGTRARIVDTRKTAPGLRALDKYAVRVGGASNHRWGLYDGVLIKENHIRAGGGITRAVASARAHAPHTLRIEVECESLDQVEECLAAGVDIIMLDNMTTRRLADAVRIIDGRATVEASGNMTLARIPEVAATGVDLISVGALTHSTAALDLSLQITDWRGTDIVV